MQITLTHERPDEGPEGGPVTAGGFPKFTGGTRAFRPGAAAAALPDQQVASGTGQPLPRGEAARKPLLARVQIVEPVRAPALLDYMERIPGVVSYVNQTFALMATAEATRPARLLTPRV